jgi:hypothetical protein
MTGLDLLFYQHDRSDRQQLLIGVGYTDMRADAATRRHVQALSFFPQLNLYGRRHDTWQSMFFVRALGPTWLSDHQLGERRQGERFCFQAQIGAGFWLGREQHWWLGLSYKHFSNAGLFSPNDSIDVPLVLSLGYRQRTR